MLSRVCPLYRLGDADGLIGAGGWGRRSDLQVDRKFARLVEVRWDAHIDLNYACNEAWGGASELDHCGCAACQASRKERLAFQASIVGADGRAIA